MYESFLKFKNWIQKYERHVSSMALLCGFVIDAFTLKRIDLLYGNLLLMSYFVIVVIGIITLNILEVRKNENEISKRISYISALAIQFAFGGLFSGFTIFYLRSGSLTTSWPFILILIALLLGNELLRKQYVRLVFQVTVFFIALFFFAIFFIPVLIDMMGPFVFLMSGVIALLFITLFLYVLYKLVPERIIRSKKYLGYAIGTAFVLINILYFSNLIPPIPLSLKAGSIYHNLITIPGGYTAQAEKRSYLSQLQFFDNIHIVRGEPLYAYSSVFAPTNIRTEVVHHWQRFDPKINRWVSVSTIPYTISGGNDRGYRGYSVKNNLSEGAWRVDVETARGQVIGRILFEIFFVDKTPDLEKVEL